MSNSFDEHYFRHVDVHSEKTIKKFKEEYDLMMKLLPLRKHDKVLEIGCGNGRLGLYLLSQENTLDMTFSDVTSVGEKALEGYKFVEASITEAPFENESFNRVYASQVINHIEDTKKAISEIYRILKNDGAFLMTTQNPYVYWIYRIWNLLTRKPWDYDETVKHIYSRSAMAKILKKSGFKWVESRYYSNPVSSKLPFNFLRRRIILVGHK